MVCCSVCDSNIAFLGYQEQKTFFSSHLSGLRSVLRGNLVGWFEPEILLFRHGNKKLEIQGTSRK